MEFDDQGRYIGGVCPECDCKHLLVFGEIVGRGVHLYCPRCDHSWLHEVVIKTKSEVFK